MKKYQWYIDKLKEERNDTGYLKEALDLIETECLVMDCRIQELEFGIKQLIDSLFRKPEFSHVEPGKEPKIITAFNDLQTILEK